MFQICVRGSAFRLAASGKLNAARRGLARAETRPSIFDHRTRAVGVPGSQAKLTLKCAACARTRMPVRRFLGPDSRTIRRHLGATMRMR